MTHDLPTPTTETRHTPGLLARGSDSGYSLQVPTPGGRVFDCASLFSDDGGEVCIVDLDSQFTRENALANRDRLEACWNACASIPGDPGEVFKDIGTLIAKYDEAAGVSSPDDNIHYLDQFIESIRAALKGEGGGEAES